MAGIYESSRDAGVGFFFLLAFTLIVLAPLGEEIVFRGFFYRGLSSGLGPFAAIIITAAIVSRTTWESSVIANLPPAQDNVISCKRFAQSTS
jgi:hypothetical protein